jgi:hypothetical protein
MTRMRRERRLVSTGAAPWLWVVATMLIQLGVLAVVPATARLAVSTGLFTLWFGGLGVVVWVVSHRRTGAAVHPGPASVPVPGADEQTPSPRMQAAWRLAMAGADAERVAQAGELPLALAELMVDNARRNPGVR